MSEHKKSFDIGDVLSITTGYLVSRRHRDGVYEILSFLHQDSIFTHQIPRASQDAQGWLQESVPQLYGQEVHSACADLTHRLKVVAAPEERAAIVDRWLVELALKYGGEFELSPIPYAKELHRNPMGELAEMVSPEKIIVVSEGGQE